MVINRQNYFPRKEHLGGGGVNNHYEITVVVSAISDIRMLGIGLAGGECSSDPFCISEWTSTTGNICWTYNSCKV